MASVVRAVNPGEGAPAVRIRGLSRSFDGRSILAGIDLDIAPGEFVALLGRSGSGKSTILRAAAGLDAGVSGGGTIEVPERRSVLFQDSRLLPWASVLDNVVLGSFDTEARERARVALREVGLAGHEDKWPKALSGGEQQRVALARALVREPELILADEPFSALDALTRLRVQRLLLQLFERHGPAVLFVTHDVEEALRLAGRVVILAEGRILYDRRTLGVRESATRFEAARLEILERLGVSAD
jgi:sulfonate transport system ATP-binding protein